jgi:carbonic anhydrase
MLKPKGEFQMITQTQTTQSALTPTEALHMLKEGNARFVHNRREDRNLLEQVSITAAGQYPLGIVLACVDSRVPPELVFDQGIGDIFSARIAGNFVNDDILGSMEFACKVAGAKVIVVLGHTKCGAVMGACDDVNLGDLTAMLSKLKPAVQAVPAPAGGPSSQDAGFVQLVAEKNVELSINAIKERSPLLNEMLEDGEIALVGAMYDVDTGEVSFY